jgi:hypothetical protein
MERPTGEDRARGAARSVQQRGADPEQIRFTALPRASRRDTGDAAYYMSEYHIATGNLPLSVSQLEMALAAPTSPPFSAAGSRPPR